MRLMTTIVTLGLGFSTAIACYGSSSNESPFSGSGGNAGSSGRVGSSGSSAKGTGGTSSAGANGANGANGGAGNAAGSENAGTPAVGGSPGDCLGPVDGVSTGQGCGCERDCDVGETCLTETPTPARDAYGAPGGMCLRGCGLDVCPDGFGCLALTPGDPSTSACLQSCDTTDDCRAGYVCQKIYDNPGTYCFIWCQADSDCSLSGHCDKYYGFCGEYPHPEAGDIGDPCSNDSDCKSEICVTGSEFPDGYCTTYCSMSRQGCPEGSACAVPLAAEGDLGACFKSCSTINDCRDPYECVVAPVDGLKVCGMPG